MNDSPVGASLERLLDELLFRIILILGFEQTQRGGGEGKLGEGHDQGNGGAKEPNGIHALERLLSRMPAFRPLHDKTHGHAKHIPRHGAVEWGP